MITIIDYTSNNIEIKELGLNLSINPYQLLNKMLSTSGNEILSEMVKFKYDLIIEDMLKDYKTFLIKPDINIVNKKTILKSVYTFGVFSREILKLSNTFDVETYYDNCTKDKKEVIDWAYSLVKYSDEYGYRTSKNFKNEF